MFALLIALAAPDAPSDSTPTCLRHLSKSRRVAISDFDASHDKHGDTSISCNFNLTASEAAADLRAIVEAAKRNDCKSLASVSAAPLSVEMMAGGTKRLSTRQICLHQDRIRRFIIKNQRAFSIDQLDLLGWRGAFVRNDSILINTFDGGHGRPHLKLVAIGPI